MERKVLVALWCLLLVPGMALAQNITISGSVTDLDGEPLIGANVVIESLVLGASTDIDGNYSFEVPAARAGQTVTLGSKYIGFTPQERQITLQAGTMTENFVLEPDLLRLDEVVVTGVSTATPTKKLAFTVSKVDASQLAEAPGGSPVSSLQGKVAGASVLGSSGQPGDAISVRLRGSTSITGDSQPLYIVDGTILGADQVDIDALDIDNVEIVKGAAASSLYGSRAQNGVIQITTKRGTNVPLNQTRVTLRNEYGTSSLRKNLEPNLSHDLSVDANGRFLNADGQPNTCATCLSNGYGPGVIQAKNGNGAAFFDKPYQAVDGQLYNAFESFFDPGDTYTNYIGISQNSAKTNFLASFTNLREAGVIKGLSGLDRQSFRVNLDHRIYNDLSLSVSGFYSQSENDAFQSALASGSRFNPFFGLMFTNPLVNLERTDENGELLVQADPLAVEENPIYIIRNTDIQQRRARVLGNFRGRYSATDWLDIESNLSYDRSDRDELEFYDRGFESIDPDDVNDGRIERRDAVSEALNADVTLSLRQDFGRLTTRGQLKAQIESWDIDGSTVIGSTLTSVGIPDLSNVKGEKQISSFNQTIRSEGYYGTAGIDYADRYIADFLVRRDGSSLFGADERWQTYYRASGAWRLSEEGWWFGGDALNEFKLRASIGTAGGRPQYEAQYETLSLSNGQISKATLGNRDLRPELQTEIEYGLNAGFYDRVFLELVYADTKVEDLLLQAPLAGYFGFASQWRNAGTIESTTIEASLNANVLSTRDLSLDFGVIFDRTTQEITDFNVNAFQAGPQTLFFFREGEAVGAMYGNRWLEDTSDLPSDLSGFANAFDVNDDGYLVPVGVGNTFRSGTGPDGVVGTDDDLWGTTVDVGGRSLRWGIPLKFQDEVENTDNVQIANSIPDFNLGFNTNLRYKGFTAYMLWGAQVGGDVYNFTKQWAYRDGRHLDQDQGAKAEDLKKSTTYYEVLYDATAKNSHFVEDATYVKLREVSLGYTFNRRQLQSIFGDRLHQISVSLIGRNLLTFTDYSGFDPEVGDSDVNNGVGGDATLFRVDDFNYPQSRTFRGKLEIQF